MTGSGGFTIRLDGADFPTPTRATWNCEHEPAPASLIRLDRLDQAARAYRSSASDERSSDPLAALRHIEEVSRSNVSPGGKWVGYISYDFGRLFESLPNQARDELDIPLFAFTYHAPSERRAPVVGERTALARSQPLTSTFSRSAYRAAVERAIEYIRAGDVFQVNLSQRFTMAQREAPLSIYNRLRRDAPASYSALIDYGDYALICNSPELFFRVTPLADGRRRIVTRPIKGTRPRLAGMDRELRDSMKDQAELHMIVDLERNDLGRICEIGSVKVIEPRTIEAHPTVYHGVATIEGILRADVGFVDILRAMFPGGSVTGAPKIRAMQIIDELEPVRRGPYCGAVGYLDADGSMEFNIAIRTMIVKDGLVHIPVGGGIVADSDPDAEYEETLVKARAMFDALGVDRQEWESL